MIFQVERKDLSCEDTPFTEKDLGKWVIIIEDSLYGRFSSADDAKSVYREVWFNHHS